MNKKIILVVSLILISACAGNTQATLSEEEIQLAIGGTLTAVKSEELATTPTLDALATVWFIGTATQEAKKENEAMKKSTEDAEKQLQLDQNKTQNAAVFMTQAAEATIIAKTPTITPTPRFTEQIQQIGPIYDSLRESSYTMELIVKDVNWKTSDDYKDPKQGNIFVTVFIEANNQGPGSVRSIGNHSFQTLDANGLLHDYELLPSTDDTCRLEIVDMISGAKLEGCVSFEVPVEGSVQFIYAPYQYEGLQPGRYLSFELRP